MPGPANPETRILSVRSAGVPSEAELDARARALGVPDRAQARAAHDRAEYDALPARARDDMLGLFAEIEET